MTRTVRYISLSLVLGFIGVAFLPQPSASVQSPSAQIDLNGIWDIDGIAGARVLIKHSPTELKASFIAGGECRPDGYARTEFLDGRPSQIITPGAINPSFTGTMIVCSGDPAMVQKCGLPSWYRTDFTIDSIEQNKISGTRFGQRINKCAAGGAADSRNFTLTRNRCAELDREITELETALTQLMEEITTFRRDAMVAAHSAAQQRYPDFYTFNVLPSFSWPTNTLTVPWFQLANNSPGSAVPIYANVEDYFFNLQTVVASEGWLKAKRMAEAMASEPNAIPEVALMREHMLTIEVLSRRDLRYQTMAVKLRDARRAWTAECSLRVAPGR
jgi:hypothetical protein